MNRTQTPFDAKMQRPTRSVQTMGEPKVTWRREPSAAGDCIDVLVFEFETGVALEIHGPKGERMSNWLLVVPSHDVPETEIVGAFAWGRAHTARIESMFRERTGS